MYRLPLAAIGVSSRDSSPAGADIYHAKFEKGAQEWRIWLNPEGIVDLLLHRSIPKPQ